MLLARRLKPVEIDEAFFSCGALSSVDSTSRKETEEEAAVIATERFIVSQSTVDEAANHGPLSLL